MKVIAENVGCEYGESFGRKMTMSFTTSQARVSLY